MSYAQFINVNPDTLREASSHLRALAIKMDTMFDKVGNVTAKLDTGDMWKGKDAAAAKAAMQSRLTSFDEMVKAVNDLSTLASDTATNIANVDMTIKRQIVSV